MSAFTPPRPVANASRLPVPPPMRRVLEGRVVDDRAPVGTPVLPPDSPSAHTARLDHAMRMDSPLPWSGTATDTWCDPRFEQDLLGSFVTEALAAADGAARLDAVHHTHWPLLQRLFDTTGALCLARLALGGEIGIEASRLLVHRGGERAAVPVHQDGTGPGLLLDPRHALTVTYLLAHEGDEPFARVAAASLADGYLPHAPLDAGAFGAWPRLLRDGRRWENTATHLRPGQALFADLRTLRSFGTASSWMALTLRLVTPLGVIRRPTDATPIRRTGTSRIRWHDPAALHRARRKALGPAHDAGADALLSTLVADRVDHGRHGTDKAVRALNEEEPL